MACSGKLCNFLRLYSRKLYFYLKTLLNLIFSLLCLPPGRSSRRTPSLPHPTTHLPRSPPAPLPPVAAATGHACLVVRLALPPPPRFSQPQADAQPRATVATEVRWKGPRASALGSLRHVAVRRNLPREDTGAAWEKEFESVVNLAAASQREGAAFHPWELAFCIVSVSASSFDSLLLSVLFIILITMHRTIYNVHH
jgi:hypothetical protein